MTPKELIEKSKQVLAQAEARLLDKRNQELVNAIKNIKIEQPHITVNPPDVKIPKIEIPPIKIPDFPAQPKQEIVVKQEPQKEVDTSGIEKTLRDVLSKFKLPKPEVKVNIPPFNKMEWPEGNLPIEGLVTLKGVSKESPLPVELRNADGSPMKFPEYIGGGSGGGRTIARIGGIDASAWGDILTPDGRLKVDGGDGEGLTDTELRASHLDVQQLSGSIDSVKVVESVTLDVKQLSGSESSVIVNNTVGVLQASGAVNSVNILQIAGNNAVVGSGYQNNALRVVHATDAIMSVRVDSSSASVAANIVDSGGIPYTTTNPLPIGDAGESLTVDANNFDIRDLTSADVVTVEDITNSVKTALIDSSGVQYSGSNPLPVTITESIILDQQTDSIAVRQVSGFEDSVVVNNTVGVQQLSGANFSVNSVNESAIDIKQVSGATDSVNVISSITLDIKQLSGSVDSVIVNDTLKALDIIQVSGSMFSSITRELPDATSTYAPTNATVSAYDNKLVIKASAGVLFSITGYNSSTSAQFIQIHNTTAMPADAGVPAVIFRVPAESSFSYSADKFGRYFSTGITVINSSTAATATKQAADCWYDAQYS